MRPAKLANLASNTIPRRTKSFAPWNVFSGLLLLPEPQSAGLVRKVLGDYGITFHDASTGVEAEQMMRGTRFDLAICDFDIPNADHLAWLQPSAAWRGITIALMNSAMNSARMSHSSPKRVQLRMPKPVSVDMLVRGLKASYTNMAQQRIANYRHSVPVKLVAGTLNHRGWQRTLPQVSVLNLSQTGLCMHAAEPLPHGASLSMSLVLPESSNSLHASGRVVWSHLSGRTGIAFDRSATGEMKKLQERLNAWLPRELGQVARLQ